MNAQDEVSNIKLPAPPATGPHPAASRAMIPAMATAVASRPTVDDTTAYVCKTCHGHFPLERMAKSHRRGGVVVYGRCLRCTAAGKRAQERRLQAAPRSRSGALVEPVAESDPWPARMLRELMSYDRAFGLGFDEAFDEDSEFVCARVGNPLERKQWSQAFASTRSTWAAAWAGVDGPGSRLSDDLADEDTQARASAERFAQERG
jgi:hypothetical protein